MLAGRLIPRTAVRSAFTRSSLPTVAVPRWRRSYATEAEEKDLVIIGGGVAGYVAAIKAGQEGLKVRCSTTPLPRPLVPFRLRLASLTPGHTLTKPLPLSRSPVSRSAAPSAAHV